MRSYLLVETIRVLHLETIVYKNYHKYSFSFIKNKQTCLVGASNILTIVFGLHATDTKQQGYCIDLLSLCLE